MTGDEEQAESVERFVAESVRDLSGDDADDTFHRLIEAGPRVLVGTPLLGADGRKVPPGSEQRFTVSELPDDWPLEWPSGSFAFPEVYPKMPARKDYPPEQVNVDRLASFVIE